MGELGTLFAAIRQRQTQRPSSRISHHYSASRYNSRCMPRHLTMQIHRLALVRVPRGRLLEDQGTLVIITCDTTRLAAMLDFPFHWTYIISLYVVYCLCSDLYTCLRCSYYVGCHECLPMYLHSRSEVPDCGPSGVLRMSSKERLRCVTYGIVH